MSQSNSELLPIRFDPVSFADHSSKLNGTVAVKAMSRLLENVISAESMVTVKLQFSRGLYGYPLAVGEAHIKVRMQCERCLDEVELRLDPAINVLIKPEAENLPSEGENHENEADFHEYDGKSLTLSDLIEEELLLAIPQVPRHEDISLCNQDMIAWLASNDAPNKGQNERQEGLVADKADNPFAILKR